MTTYFPFTPSNVAAPQFQPTLDGQVCNCIVTWNLFGQRYFVNCYDSTNTLVFSVALIETGPAINIETMVWDGASFTITVTTNGSHGFALGATINLTIASALPTTYDGTYLMLATGVNTLTFYMNNDPGALIAPGFVSYLISLSGGYFNSTMVYRNSQFEVSP